MNKRLMIPMTTPIKNWFPSTHSSCHNIARNLAVFGLLFLTPSAAYSQVIPQTPKLAAASDEGEKMMGNFKYPPNLRINLFAAEPDVGNPVSFHVDHQGRVFVCESYRQGKGIEDNRNHAEWLDEDLAAQSVADRIAYIKKHVKNAEVEYTKHDDRIRLLLDNDGDGKADKNSIFAKHFNQIEMGTGAGVLSFRDKVYYTCIPDVWMIEDTNGDGVSEKRKSLHTGYGVRFAFRGHDSHGLIVGPDGRLYFSIGDRGYNIQSGGKQLKDPASGAVFRCELDGSNLEVVATGLRNPQELAFDEFGNLFTGDNNSDSGDKARWVYVVPGSDSGWRMYYQYLPDRGPFNREKIWNPFSEESPAYTVPPVTNLADGPSGLAYYPGTGLGKEFNGKFFLCDFRGGPVNSGIRTFRVKAKGAFFEVADMEETFWRQLVTDVQFAPDGSMLVSDWVNGWEGLGKGRIYRYTNPEAEKDMLVAEVKKLLNEGMPKLDTNRLTSLLESPDQRVRQEAQFELAIRGDLNALKTVALDDLNSTLPRIHALWGIGQILRDKDDKSEIKDLVSLFDADDDEVRGQYAKLVGDIGVTKYASQLANLLLDDNKRVQYFAAMSLGKQEFAANDKSVSSKLIAMLDNNSGTDPIVRHGAIMALVYDQSGVLLKTAAKDSSRFVRMAAVIAMRKLKKQELVSFLSDPEPTIVVEAVRAIHDLPISENFNALAKLISNASASNPVIRRVLNANFRLGTKEHAWAIARFASNKNADELMRLEAIDMLKTWATPSSRDRVLGDWRPMKQRSSEIAASAIQNFLPTLLSGSPKLTKAVIDAATELKLKEIEPTVKNIFANSTNDGPSRADALRAMATLNVKELKQTILKAVNDKSPAVRIAARDLIFKTDPGAARKALEAGVNSENVAERQAAYATIGSTPNGVSKKLIAQSMQRLLAGKVPADTRLDVILAANSIGGKPIRAQLAAYEKSLEAANPISKYIECKEGGNAARGATIFFEKGAVYCMRCHKIEDRGGEVGPNLSQIGKEKDRQYLLEAIVMPDAAIAKNFETVMVDTDDGLSFRGILKSEDETTLVLITPEAKAISIDKETIEQRGNGKSSMPADLVKNLSLSEIRDLVAYLKSLDK